MYDDDPASVRGLEEERREKERERTDLKSVYECPVISPNRRFLLASVG